MTALAKATALGPGTKLGRYQILRLLAVGGMAEIYLARATGIAGFEKVVVLKRILPRLADSPEFVDMFLDEARLTATLNHPNVVQVHDVDRIDDNYFFTMEFVHGRDLASVLRRAAGKKRGLTLAHAVYVVKEVARGLHYAHDRKGKDGHPLGTVHRDVSTNNVMITYDGGVKIVDFGIAKAAIRETKTKTGTVKGTVLYMSPEQAQGHELDRRSDVFSLGVLLYQLTTGTRPFNAPNELAVLFKLVNEDAPLPSERRPGYPEELERIVVKAMQRKRENRHDTAAELADELEAFMRSADLAASPTTLGTFMKEIFDEREDTAEMVALRLAPGSNAPEPALPTPTPDEVPTRQTGASGSLPKTETMDSASVVIPVQSAIGLKLFLSLALLGTLFLGYWLWSRSTQQVTSAPVVTPPPSAAPVAEAPPRASETPTPPPEPEIDAAVPAAATASSAPRPKVAPPPREPPPAKPPPKPSAAAPASGKPKWDLDSPLPP